MADNFTTTCQKCNAPIKFTVKKDSKGNRIPNLDKPGKFFWNPPIDESGETHVCGVIIKGCYACHKRPCECKYIQCPLCSENYGWFRTIEEVEYHKLLFHG